MVNRDLGSYRQVIQVLKNKILEVTNRRWRPTTVISDFEQASMTAFETEFPWITVKGCYFHFNQALWRAIQRYALAKPYRNSRRLKKCLKKVMALGFLPLAFVRFNFNRLRQSHAIRCLIRRFPTLHDLFDVLRKQLRKWKLSSKNVECVQPSHGDTHKPSC